ncbi:hypothetical protein [Paenibacillus glycanilyticus]|uniref:Uncharacterized protein n=1 Tax=Paenibacillus glycanilyticus TaxID=126569 RepID=A0ABQ6GGJ5_9BACL|nr:hypothetical protein [Paenibacillus glycanilyticus]GLX68762.1 hypothetical protein MU1_31070 [Paenibacillus glycanilyticus]
MKIYVVVSFAEDGMENVYVGDDLERVQAMTAEDFENCDALFVEIWEDGEKTDDYRVGSYSEDEELEN